MEFWKSHSYTDLHSLIEEVPVLCRLFHDVSLIEHQLAAFTPQPEEVVTVATEYLVVSGDHGEKAE